MKRMAAGGAAHRAPRGFTLVEATVVVGILGVLIALAVFGLSEATRRARLSGAKFTLVSTINFARQRALARGVDVYVIVSNADSASNWPPSSAARVLVYEDPTLQLRGSTTNLMAVVNANPRNIREEFTAAGDTFGSSGMAFVDLRSTTPVPPCAEATPGQLPAYMTVSGARLTTSACARAFCTFCSMQNGQCIGAVRFNADGQARLVTATSSGTGGLFKLVSPTDNNNAACIAIGEPSGIAVIL